MYSPGDGKKNAALAFGDAPDSGERAFVPIACGVGIGLAGSVFLALAQEFWGTFMKRGVKTQLLVLEIAVLLEGVALMWHLVHTHGDWFW